MTEGIETGPRGLTTTEAQARLEQYGPNRLVARERAAWLKDLASLALDPMAIMLLIAAGVYVALGERRDAVFGYLRGPIARLSFEAALPVAGRRS